MRLRRTIAVFLLLCFAGFGAASAFTGFFGLLGHNARSSGNVSPGVPTIPASQAQTLNPSPPPRHLPLQVVDDTGSSDERLQDWLAIKSPITFSIMPYYGKTDSDAQALQAAGQQVMLHCPEENDPPNSYSGKGQLTVGMDEATVDATLDADVAQIPGLVGMNNHQGGRAGNDMELQRKVARWCRDHGIFLMDSMASTKPVAYKAAVEAGMAVRKNDVFIDHDNNPDYIRNAMRQLADLARKHGTAIGICHFGRPNTARTVGEMIKTLEAEGIRFDFVSNISNGG
ncbi:MAG: divergent polysaccharide deacetylase family protein [Actinobacteria bacterium]|nr:divergent polysaccharide deacetylase family protein [Actinomycetota bacterium]